MRLLLTLIVISNILIVIAAEVTCDKTNEVRDCDHQPERTFIAIKPDAVQRGLVGEILSRFERKGFKLVAMSMMSASRELLETHYEEHRDRSFFASLIDYMMSGPVVATVWEGSGVISAGRSLLGATNPVKAAAGTIRGDFALDTGRNLCHASDSAESAEREVKLWFSNQIVHWKSDLSNWIFEK